MEAPAAGSRILVVDDERPVADTLATVFRKHGYEVQTAYSAEGAIELMAEWRPDVAIVDVMLPGMSGIDLAIVLKHDFPLCPVLLFSGSAHTGELLDEAAERGHNFEILAKPIHPQQILESVSILLAAAIAGHAIRHSN